MSRKIKSLIQLSMRLCFWLSYIPSKEEVSKFQVNVPYILFAIAVFFSASVAGTAVSAVTAVFKSIVDSFIFPASASSHAVPLYTAIA